MEFGLLSCQLLAILLYNFRMVVWVLPNGPLEKLFSQIYNGNYYYVIWNDQFKGDPDTSPLDTPENRKYTAMEKVRVPMVVIVLVPWGHSKGSNYMG